MSVPQHFTDTEKVCAYIKEQLDAHKELMNEKFARIIENQSTATERINAKGIEINEVKDAVQSIRTGEIAQLRSELTVLRTEKDTSTRNTRWLVIIIGVLLGALEIYLLFSK